MSKKKEDPMVRVEEPLLSRETSTFSQYNVYREGELTGTTCNTRVCLPSKNNYPSLTMRHSVYDVIRQITGIELAKAVSEFLKENEELVRRGIITGDDLKVVIAVSK